MKHTRRFLAMLLALVLTLGLCVTAFAEGEDAGTTTTTETGSITVNNAVNGKTYKIYRIFDLNDHSTNYDALNYKVSSKWTAFFENGARGLDYVTIDDMHYVTWRADKSDSDVAAFAKAAIEFAEAQGISPDGQQEASNGTANFDNLTLGYYLVKSNLGALCSLDTTKPNVTMREKNSESTIDKQVTEDNSGNPGKYNDAEIGQDVDFTITVNVIDGQPKGYVVHDKMTAGLKFKSDSLEVKKQDGTVLTAADYELVYSQDGTVLDDGCTFHVVFKDNTDDDGNATSSIALKPNDVITLTYKATVTASATVETGANTNETQLKYGDSHETTWSTTKTYTLSLKGYKYTEKNEGTKTPLKGAEFRLYKEDADGKKTYAILAGGVLKEWTEDATKATTIISGEDGNFNVAGLDSDTYFLEEIKAPAGYNKLKDPVKVKINGTYENADNTASVTYKVGNAEEAEATDKVNIENQTGATLPSTGGIGTTIFYALGSVMALGAGILLVTKKRMAAE